MILSKFDRALRWIVLISVLVNVGFNYLSATGYVNSATIEEVTLQYENTFTPAGFTFSIWSVIYLSFIIYAVYQLLPSQKNNTVHSIIAIPFILANMLCMLWLLVFSYELIGVSLLVMFATFIAGLIQFQFVKRAIAQHRVKEWVAIPFSLFFGWITVATLANFSTWFVAYTGRATPSALTMALIGVAVVAAIVVTLRYRDWVYPLVVAWACAGIWSANREFYNQIAFLAAGAAVLLVVVIIVHAIVTFFKSQQRLEY